MTASLCVGGWNRTSTSSEGGGNAGGNGGGGFTIGSPKDMGAKLGGIGGGGGAMKVVVAGGRGIRSPGRGISPGKGMSMMRGKRQCEVEWGYYLQVCKKKNKVENLLGRRRKI